MDIKITNSNIHTELVLTGLGRADLVDESLGVVWEVKHAGKNPEERMLIAVTQAVSYIGTSQNGNTIYGLGNAGAFESSFYITVSDYSYFVSYTTPIDGVVLYTVSDIIGGPIPSDARVYAYITQKERNIQKAASLGYVAIGCGISGYSGGSMLGKDIGNDFLYCGG